MSGKYRFRLLEGTHVLGDGSFVSAGTVFPSNQRLDEIFGEHRFELIKEIIPLREGREKPDSAPEKEASVPDKLPEAPPEIPLEKGQVAIKEFEGLFVFTEVKGKGEEATGIIFDVQSKKPISKERVNVSNTKAVEKAITAFLESLD